VFLVGLTLAAVATGAAADDKSASREDLDRVQGTWEREAPQGSDLPYHRATKEVHGNKETVTFYAADGKILRRHQVDFKLSRAGDVGVFTYSNMEVTDGEQKGTKSPESHSYVYRVSGDEFREATGLLPAEGDEEPSITIWKKSKSAAGDAPAAGKAGAIDAKALAGTWEPTMNQRGGNVEPEEQTKRHRLVFDGQKFSVTRDGEKLIAGTWTVNNDAKPAQIDMKIEDSQNEEDKGKTVLGIIEVTGDGMKWCTGGPRSTVRPTEFASEEGSRDMFVVLKREKKKE
jgi:uncharacterized protein (TIGR03067 family)